MKLTFLNASGKKNKYTATIQQTGRLAFNSESNAYLNLSTTKYFRIAWDSEKGSINKLILVEGGDETNAAKIYKVGNYYFLKLEDLFDELKFDYKKKSLTYSIHKSENYENSQTYVLNKIESSIRKKNSTSLESEKVLNSIGEENIK